jgi:hypothetical protein
LTSTDVDGEALSDDGAGTELPLGFNSANLAVAMIVVSVVLAFMLGSTFV